MSRFSLFGYVLPLAALLGSVACSSNGTTPDSGSGGQGAGGLKSSGSGGASGSSHAGSSNPSGTGGGSGSAGTTAGGGGGDASGTSGKGGSSSARGGSSSGGEGGHAGSAGRHDGSGGSTHAPEGGPGSGGSTSPRDGGAGSGGRAAGDGALGGEGGGTGSGGQDGGTGGSSGNNPCKASPCVILPLGDSITLGYGSSDNAGYRSGLFKLAVAANQNITFIGSLTNPTSPLSVSGKDLPRNHEGHMGYTVSQITDYVPPKKAFSTTPHIVLLHAGTNDMTNNADATTTAKQLDTLISDLVAAAPDALVVVAKIVPLGYNNANYTSYIGQIQDLVKAQAAKNHNVVMVDMSTLPASDIKGNGDVHPTDKGYSDMAGLWYGAIKTYLPN